MSVFVILGPADRAASATSHKSHHQTPRDSEPDTTAAIPTKPAVRTPETATKPDDGALAPPFHLPAASRVRMRDCGLKWQAMKMSGEAGDDIWRDFATSCLAAANGPFEKR